MELFALALPFLTAAVMFAYKKLARLRAFENGAEARPWLRLLLAITSIIGVCAVALLNGTPVDPNAVTDLLATALAAGLNSFLAHAFYKQVKPAQ